MFSCEFCKVFKNSFFYWTPAVAAFKTYVTFFTMFNYYHSTIRKLLICHGNQCLSNNTLIHLLNHSNPFVTDCSLSQRNHLKYILRLTPISITAPYRSHKKREDFSFRDLSGNLSGDFSVIFPVIFPFLVTMSILIAKLFWHTTNSWFFYLWLKPL